MPTCEQVSQIFWRALRLLYCTYIRTVVRNFDQIIVLSGECLLHYTLVRTSYGSHGYQVTTLKETHNKSWAPVLCIIIVDFVFQLIPPTKHGGGKVIGYHALSVTTLPGIRD